MDRYVEGEKLAICEGMSSMPSKLLIDRHILPMIFGYYDPQTIVDDFANSFPRIDRIQHLSIPNAWIIIHYHSYNFRIVSGYNICPYDYSSEFTGYPDILENKRMITEDIPLILSQHSQSADDDELPPSRPILYRTYRPVYQYLVFSDDKPAYWSDTDNGLPSRSEQDILIFKYLMKINDH